MSYTVDFDVEAAKQQIGMLPKTWGWAVSFETAWRQRGMTEEGLPHFEPEEMIHLKAGSNHLVKNVEVWRNRHPGEWTRYVEPLYVQWKRTAEQPTQGTPLELIPVLSTPVVLQLKTLNITSAEQLVDADAKVLERMPDGTRHRDAVKRFLEAGKKASEMSKVIKERDDLRERVKYLEDELKRIDKKFKDLGGK